MGKELENPATTTTAAAQEYTDEIDSCCSTPYVSAPSSPGRDAPLSGYYYSAPASPMHFMLSAATNYTSSSASASTDASGSFDFDFSATLPSSGCASPESMTSADELFCNGQIRPMKLSSHLRRPQLLDPLIESSDDDVSEDQTFGRGRELKFRSGSLRRRARSMSPMRSTTTPFHRDTDDDCKNIANTDDDDDGKSPRTDADADANNLEEEEEEKAGTTSETAAACASRSSSSKRWVFLKEFLYRSKSEGRNDGHKFWGSLSSFSPVVKDKKMTAPATKTKQQINTKTSLKSKRRAGVVPPSAHEVHYNAKRAQAEEMRKKTFLPYRQGLFGCLGFNSKSYAAINGFARATFNTTPPVSSR
ncbi:hypothetical protein ABFS82_02G094400 [Erythranthe guttata]|uniref:Uncharacterized protein n=1 Tax=Erythranthe guttata TaxID=4155 RepID=A0A022RA89_ERYGU|nr:PREDICTED: uncharacterized protein LOC105958215 [Erythranthe guttata]EYU37262.1 hypothetical protein MIMGU_mgv1a008826mg [Erythranthe guttata]|eukprot:XP_012837672.1 PREDICTED: uncharacterized protein LOC105958215 [Erythranthe guttata]